MYYNMNAHIQGGINPTFLREFVEDVPFAKLCFDISPPRLQTACALQKNRL